MTVMGYADIPPAPAPNEPEGCYGNPLRGGEVPYIDRHGAELFHKLANRKIDSVYGWKYRYFALSERLLNSSDNELYKKLYERKDNCWQRLSGIFECMQGKDADRNDYRINRILKINGT